MLPMFGFSSLSVSIWLKTDRVALSQSSLMNQSWFQFCLLNEMIFHSYFFFFFFLSQASFSQVYCSNDSRCARCAEGCCSIIYSGTGNQYIQFQGQKKTWRVSACGNLANLDLRCFVIMLLFVHICGVIYFLPLPLSLWTSWVCTVIIINTKRTSLMILTDKTSNLVFYYCPLIRYINLVRGRDDSWYFTGFTGHILVHHTHSLKCWKDLKETKTRTVKTTTVDKLG